MLNDVGKIVDVNKNGFYKLEVRAFFGSDDFLRMISSFVLGFLCK